MPNLIRNSQYAAPAQSLMTLAMTRKTQPFGTTQREIRAELIRWLCVDPNAIKLIQPDGISVIGASVVGSLNLDYVHPPFGVRLVRSSIPDLMSLQYAELGILILSGSYTGEIHGGSSHLLHGVYMNSGFHASGEVFFGGSQIDGNLILFRRQLHAQQGGGH